MTTGVRLFLSTMAFAGIIAGLYAYSTRDIAGTILLGMLTLALGIIALYTVVAERNADLQADDASSSPEFAVGETIGVFSLESYWPIVLALALVIVLIGLTFLPGFSGSILLIGAALLAFVLRMLVREST